LKKEILLFRISTNLLFLIVILNYFSRYLLCQKIETIIGLIDRVFSLSYFIYHQKNFELIIKILLNNGYPLKLIFSKIKIDCQKNLNNEMTRVTHLDKTIMKIKLITILFILLLSEKIKKILKKSSLIYMAYKKINNLRGFIRGHKERE